MSKEKTPKKEKPKAKLIGADSNVFVLMGICSKELKRAGMHDEAKQMTDRVWASGSFNEALAIMTEYVEPY
jgi:hypothetical protein